MGKIKKKDKDNNSTNDLLPPIIGYNQTSQIIKEEKKETSNNTANQPNKLFSLWNKSYQATIANIISFLMFVATVFLAIYTLGILKKTSIQTDNAIKSANAAFTADSLSKVALDSANSYRKQDIASQKISDLKKSKRDDSIFNLQKKSVNAQIASLKQTQRQFEIINRPYLQFSGFYFTEIREGQYISYKFILKNYGVAPVKVLSKKIKIVVARDGQNVDFDNVINTAKKYPVLSFVGSDGLIFQEGSDMPAVYPKILYSSQTGYFYLVGEIEYMNLINKKIIFYTFKVKIFDFKTDIPCNYQLF